MMSLREQSLLASSVIDSVHRPTTHDAAVYFSMSHTEYIPRSMSGCWHNPVVCPSLCLSVTLYVVALKVGVQG